MGMRGVERRGVPAHRLSSWPAGQLQGAGENQEALRYGGVRGGRSLGPE